MARGKSVIQVVITGESRGLKRAMDAAGGAVLGFTAIGAKLVATAARPLHITPLRSTAKTSVRCGGRSESHVGAARAMSNGNPVSRGSRCLVATMVIDVLEAGRFTVALFNGTPSVGWQ